MPPKAIIKRFLEDSAAQTYIERFKNTNIFATRKVTAEVLLDQADDDELSPKAKRSKIPVKTGARVYQCTSSQKLDALSGKVDYMFESIWNKGKNEFVVVGGAQSNSSKCMLERTDHGTLNQIHHLSNHDLYQLAADSFNRLQELADTQETRHMGACVTNVIVDPVNQRLITISLGNLPAWLYVLDKDGKADIIELNECLHVVDDKQEQQRLKEYGTRTTSQAGVKTLLGGSVVTRALGSVWAEQHDLIHIPSIRIRSYKDLQSALKIMLVLPNQGLLACSQFARKSHMMNVLNAKENQYLSPFLTAKTILEATATSSQSASLIMSNLPFEPVTLDQEATALSLTVSSGLGDNLVADIAIKNIARFQQELVDEIIRKKHPAVLATSTNTASTSRRTELLQETELQREEQQPEQLESSSSATIPMTPSTESGLPTSTGALQYVHGTLDDDAGISYFGPADVQAAMRENFSPAF